MLLHCHLQIQDSLNPDPLFNLSEFKWTVKNPDMLLETISQIENLSNEDYSSRQRKARVYTDSYINPATASKMEESRVAPMLQWAVTQPTDKAEDSERVESLRLAADVYQARAQRNLQRLRQWVPVFALIFVGGAMTLLYVLSVFGPFLQLLIGLM